MSGLRQIGVFSAIGLAATASHVAVGLALHRGFAVSPFAANLAAFFVATSLTICGNGRLTFGVRLTAARIARALTGVVATLGLNQMIVYVFVEIWTLPYEAALVIIIATVPAVSFLLLKYWAFRE